MGEPSLSVVKAEERVRVQDVFDKLAVDKQPMVDLEIWLTHTDGHELCMSINGIPVLDQEGNLTGYRGANRDITVRKRAEDQIRLARARMEMLYEVSRGLNTVSDEDGLLDTLAEVGIESGAVLANLQYIDLDPSN